MPKTNPTDLPTNLLTDLLTKTSLKEYAGPVYYERGVGYFENDAVELRSHDAQAISARVEGSETYSVSIRAVRKQLDWSCSCPLGDDGEFCKHVVATGLAWLARKPAKNTKAVKAAKAAKHESPEYESPDLAAIRDFVKRSDKKTLGELLLQQAAENDTFAAKLAGASLRRGAVKPAALKTAIRNALAVNGFHDYRQTREVVARAAEVPVLIGDVLDRDDAGSAAELAEYALRLGFDAIEQVDDSSGGMSGVLEEIAEVHLQACRRGGMPARKIAHSLFELQLEDPIGLLALEPYRKALGKEGLAAYRKLAQTAWQNIPARTADEKRGEHDAMRYQMTRIMKTLAGIDNDVDALLEILKRDLRFPHDYLGIAQTLAKAKRHDEALQWAEDGRKMFPDGFNHALEDFLAAEYHRRKRHDDAIALHWARFKKHPVLQNYQILKASTDKNHAWNAWREKALALLRDTAQKSAARGSIWASNSGDTIAEIYLWERNPIAALAAARAHGCAGPRWLALAQALETDQPGESIRIYQAQIEPIIRRSAPGYHEAAQLIERLSTLMRRAQQQQAFVNWLAGVRLRYKAKRNFIKELDRLAAQKKL